jgi:hypothetical protein
VSTRTRTCLGCHGTGLSCSCDPAGLPGLFCKDCPACLGSGTVTEPDSRKDAMADADTLRSIYRQHHKARGYSRTLVAKAGAGGDYIIQARPWLGTDGKDVGRRAAQLAFRAVPALKGESL